MTDSPDGRRMGHDSRPTDFPLVASAPSILDPEDEPGSWLSDSLHLRTMQLACPEFSNTF
jgi:hypothetical protein